MQRRKKLQRSFGPKEPGLRMTWGYVGMTVAVARKIQKLQVQAEPALSLPKGSPVLQKHRGPVNGGLGGRPAAKNGGTDNSVQSSKSGPRLLGFSVAISSPASGVEESYSIEVRSSVYAVWSAVRTNRRFPSAAKVL